MIEKLKVDRGTIIRTIVLIFVIINQFLTLIGKNPIPYSNEEFENVVAFIADFVATIVVWWKNNSFTQAALHGDERMKEIRQWEWEDKHEK